MRIINKEEIIIFWINNKSNQDRYKHMESLLKKNFPKNKTVRIDAIMEEKKYNGVSFAHMVTVLKGFKTKKPFLVLEDDVSFSETWNNIFPLEIDNNISAIYFGLSAWGKGNRWDPTNYKILNQGNQINFYKGSEVSYYDNNYCKINNMYGAHAILYLKKKYMLETATMCMMAIIADKPHDILLLDLQKKYNVIGLMNPMFYQSNKIGGQQNATKLEINKNQFKEKSRIIYNEN